MTTHPRPSIEQIDALDAAIAAHCRVKHLTGELERAEAELREAVEKLEVVNESKKEEKQ